MAQDKQKPVSKLTKDEALKELEVLGEEIDFEEEYNENTPVKDLRELVKQGRELLAEDDEDTSEIKADSESEEEEKVSEVDYLQKYQCKKVNGNPVVGGKISDPEPGSRAENMKKVLLKQPRVRILINADGKDKGFPLSVNLNGYKLDLPRNTYIDVPEQVGEVVRKSQQQRIEALEQKQVTDDMNELRG